MISLLSTSPLSIHLSISSLFFPFSYLSSNHLSPFSIYPHLPPLFLFLFIPKFIAPFPSSYLYTYAPLRLSPLFLIIPLLSPLPLFLFIPSFPLLPSFYLSPNLLSCSLLFIHPSISSPLFPSTYFCSSFPLSYLSIYLPISSPLFPLPVYSIISFPLYLSIYLLLPSSYLSPTSLLSSFLYFPSFPLSS